MLTSAHSVLRFDAFILDPARYILLRGSSVVPLRRQSLEVLRYFAEHAGQVVSNDELVRALWVSKPSDPSSSVGQCVKEIRRAIGAEARWIIKTIPGQGYVFKAEVVRTLRPQSNRLSPSGLRGSCEARASGVVESTAAAAKPLRAGGRVRWAAAAAGIACAMIGAAWLLGRSTVPSTAVAPARPATELFSEMDAGRVAALSQLKQLPVPPFAIHAPSDDVPMDIRRFVGVWMSETGWIGSNRQYMLLVTDVSKDGSASGYFVNGPPQPRSRIQSPAHFGAIKGRISKALLLYNDRAGAEFSASLSAQGQIEVTMITQDGFAGWVALKPLWTLVEAERATANLTADWRP